MHWLFTAKHWQILFTVLLLAEPCLSSAGQETLNYQGLNRTYYVHVPENLKQGASLVVVLHGYTSSAETIMSYSGMNEVADVNNFIAVYPQGTIDSLGNTFFNKRKLSKFPATSYPNIQPPSQLKYGSTLNFIFTEMEYTTQIFESKSFAQS